ncbi:MAG: hypothetical protein M1813_007728 [Trichoglossum hirsutum]|nr:MAG: hypothetical protein M1813_007728 [Trichoglossum hirsutum]
MLSEGTSDVESHCRRVVYIRVCTSAADLRGSRIRLLEFDVLNRLPGALPVSYAAYTYHSRLAVRAVRPLVPSFTIIVEGKSFTIQRQPSSIWHQDTLEMIQGRPQGSSADPTDLPIYTSTSLSRLLGPNTIVLQFEAEAIQYDPTGSEVKWLNTGPDAGGLRLSLRHGYSKAIRDTVSQYDAGSLNLIAMALCDVIGHSMRGGQFLEKKTWGNKDELVVMLIRWKGELAERIAIGCTSPEKWEKLSPQKKNIRLC